MVCVHMCVCICVCPYVCVCVCVCEVSVCVVCEMWKLHIKFYQYEKYKCVHGIMDPLSHRCPPVLQPVLDKRMFYPQKAHRQS